MDALKEPFTLTEIVRELSRRAEATDRRPEEAVEGGSEATDGATTLCVFVDIGGNRELESLAALLPFLAIVALSPFFARKRLDRLGSTAREALADLNRSLELDPNGQYTYNLITDFGDPGLDPGNPYSVDNGFSVASELRMPGWPASPPPTSRASRTGRSIRPSGWRCGSPTPCGSP